MAWFTAKEWKNRLAEFAGRRTLTDVSTGTSQVVDVTRNEGTISQEGDAFSAANMNEFEQRILEGFNQAETANTELNKKIESFQNGVDTISDGCTTYGSTPTESTPTAIVNAIKAIYNNRYSAGVAASKPISLGTGTSFNVSGYSGYKNFTANNFIVEPTDQGFTGINHGLWNNNNTHSVVLGTLTKSYNASTGVLTAYYNIVGGFSYASTFWGDGSGKNSKNVPVKAYLIP